MANSPVTRNETSTAVEVVQRQVDAYNSRDLAAFLATYSPAIIITRDLDGPAIMNGLDELRAAYGELFASSPNLHCEIVNRIVVGDLVIDQE